MAGVIARLPMAVGAKAAVLSASPSVVSVVTHNIPDDMINSGGIPFTRRSDTTYVFGGSGIIIECNQAGDGRSYDCVIIAPATLFKRTNNLQPTEIEVDVYLLDGMRYKGEIIACDVHYNLAAVRIQSDSKLQTATLKGLDDVTYIDVSKHRESCKKETFEFLPSSLYKILPGTEIMSIWRTCLPPYDIRVISGVFSAQAPYSDSSCCKELFWLLDSGFQGDRGGAVINFFGEVIGIMFYDAPFLPSNLISRWWSHFKNYREYRRPWLGVDILNLPDSNLKHLEQFAGAFPNVASGVVVTKVDQDSPAYYSGIQPEDVVVSCNGKPIRSILEFFEEMWDNTGKSVELNVLRVSSGHQSNLSVTVGETTPDKYYEWWQPSCNFFPSEAR